MSPPQRVLTAAASTVKSRRIRSARAVAAGSGIVVRLHGRGVRAQGRDGRPRRRLRSPPGRLRHPGGAAGGPDPAPAAPARPADRARQRGRLLGPVPGHGRGNVPPGLLAAGPGGRGRPSGAGPPVPATLPRGAAATPPSSADRVPELLDLPAVPR